LQDTKKAWKWWLEIVYDHTYQIPTILAFLPGKKDQNRTAFFNEKNVFWRKRECNYYQIVNVSLAADGQSREAIKISGLFLVILRYHLIF
jgi:hypothetical protein